MQIKPTIDTILFDLDGTLLPMQLEAFTTAYMKDLSKKTEQFSYESSALVRAVWAGTKSALQNDGTISNEMRFWSTFESLMGEGSKDALEQTFLSYYQNEFHELKHATGENANARKLIDHLKSEGYDLIIATNPVFPRSAVLARLSWIGLTEDDFKWITSFEICNYCKPNPKFFEQVLHDCGKLPETCIMIGNDVDEDGAATTLGIETYFVTDDLINRSGVDISTFPHGTFEDLMKVFGVAT